MTVHDRPEYPAAVADDVHPYVRVYAQWVVDAGKL
jgi:hypothetical protein